MIRKVWCLSYITNFPAPGDHFDTHMAAIIIYNEYTTSTSDYSYKPVSVYLWLAHIRAVVFHTLHRGQRDTRICPYLVTFAKLYFLCRCTRPGVFIPPPPATVPPHTRPRLPPPSTWPLSGLYLLYPTTASPPRPGVLSVSSHRSRIDRVAMNCAAVFCLLRMYSSIALKHASSIATVAEIYSHFTS